MKYIVTKRDLTEALNAECLFLPNDRSVLFWGVIKQDYVALFLYSLRNMEFHFNNKGIYHKMMFVLWHSMWMHYSVKTGLSIPKNVADKGMTIGHFGSVVINAASELGKNCCVMNNANIGANPGQNGKAPKIGRDVYIGPGAVLYGDIKIADGCYIGANAVVNKSFLDPHSVIVGVPAKVVNTDPVVWWKKCNYNREHI